MYRRSVLSQFDINIFYVQKPLRRSSLYKLPIEPLILIRGVLKVRLTDALIGIIKTF